HLFYLLANVTYCNTYLSKSSALRFYYDFLRRDSIHVGYPALSENNDGGGSYTLRWSKPPMAVTEYILKYSEKQIVQNLNFDNVSRTYEYDTAQYCNFWAAEEPLQNPAPSDTEMTISGLNPSSSYHFMLKYISDRSVSGSIGVESRLTVCPETWITVYPNPFNPTVTVAISGRTGEKGVTQPLQIAIYDLHGRLVADLSWEIKNNRVCWSANAQSSGVYIVRAKAGKRVMNRKIILLR
ncbi:MAG: T9SS type A sorting domain-containing protein, partial [Fibrobacterota bacterium]